MSTTTQVQISGIEPTAKIRERKAEEHIQNREFDEAKQCLSEAAELYMQLYEHTSQGGKKIYPCPNLSDRLDRSFCGISGSSGLDDYVRIRIKYAEVMIMEKRSYINVLGFLDSTIAKYLEKIHHITLASELPIYLGLLRKRIKISDKLESEKMLLNRTQ